MESDDIETRLGPLMEELASAEHERWAHWQRYMHSLGERMENGSLVIPADIVAHWERQIDRPYTALTEEEKESDREQVRRYLPLIVQALTD